MVTLLVYVSFLSLFSIGLIHYYEDKLKKVNLEVELYKDAYNSEHNAIHVELDNNDALKAQIKSMQEELGYLRNRAGSQEIQYESHTYKNTTWDSSKYETIIEL
jgi:cell division protein FtsB